MFTCRAVKVFAERTFFNWGSINSGFFLFSSSSSFNLFIKESSPLKAANPVEIAVLLSLANTIDNGLRITG